MRRVRPADVVQLGVPLGVGLRRLREALPVALVDGALLRQQEARSEPGCLRAERQHSRDTAPVADAARGDHRCGEHGVDDCGDERQRGDGAPDVPARFPALRDDDIDAGRHRAPRLVRAPDRVQDDAAGVMHGADVRRRVAPCEGDDPQPGVERSVEASVLVPLEHEIGAERTIRERERLAHERAGVVRPRQRERPERAGVRNRCCERRHRDRPDRRLHDGVVDPELVAERGAHASTL